MPSLRARALGYKYYPKTVRPRLRRDNVRVASVAVERCRGVRGPGSTSKSLRDFVWLLVLWAGTTDTDADDDDDVDEDDDDVMRWIYIFRMVACSTAVVTRLSRCRSLSLSLSATGSDKLLLST